MRDNDTKMLVEVYNQITSKPSAAQQTAEARESKKLENAKRTIGPRMNDPKFLAMVRAVHDTAYQMDHIEGKL